MKRTALAACLLALIAGLVVESNGAAPVPVSDILAVDDLVAEIKSKSRKLGTALQDEASLQRAIEFDTLATDAGTIACLAQALVEHKEGSKTGISAAALRDAAMKLAETEDLKEAQTGLEKINAAIAGKGGDAKAEHAWDELVDMHRLMLEMELRQVKLRRSISRPRRLERDSVHASVLIALALAMEADTYGLEDDDLKEWTKWAKRYREEAVGIANAMKADDAGTARKLFEKSDVSCKACHKAFRD
ncbi:MAG: hypothetical protein ACYTGL_11845 [Planctomycetota bacterium]